MFKIRTSVALLVFSLITQYIRNTCLVVLAKYNPLDAVLCTVCFQAMVERIIFKPSFCLATTKGYQRNRHCPIFSSTCQRHQMHCSKR